LLLSTLELFFQTLEFSATFQYDVSTTSIVLEVLVEAGEEEEEFQIRFYI
jgi:hypothetical protein